MLPPLVRKFVLRHAVHKISPLWCHNWCFLEIYRGLMFRDHSKFLFKSLCFENEGVCFQTLNTIMFICVSACATSSYSALSRACCFSWSSCFKLSTSTFSSMFWNKEKQGSRVIIQHTYSTKWRFGCRNCLFCYKRKNFHDHHTNSQHFHLNISQEENVLEHKWCVRTRESSHSDDMRPSSWLLHCFTSLYSLCSNLSLFALVNGGRWVLSISGAQHLTELSRLLYLDLENSRQLKHSSPGPKGDLHSLFTWGGWGFHSGSEGTKTGRLWIWKWGSTFFPGDTLSNRLSGLGSGCCPYWCSSYQTLAHYHLDRLLIPPPRPPGPPPPPPPLMFSFSSACPRWLTSLLPSCQGHVVLNSRPSPWGDNACAPTPAACSKHFSEKCHRSSTRKLLFMTRAHEPTHCTTSQTLNCEVVYIFTFLCWRTFATKQETFF